MLFKENKILEMVRVDCYGLHKPGIVQTRG